LGSTQAVPGGLPVELDSFDADGRLVGRTAVLVGSSTNGQGAGPVARLTLSLRRGAAATVFVAVYVNTSLANGSPARLIFDDVAYTA
jgi:hypothetical protein